MSVRWHFRVELRKYEVAFSCKIAVDGYFLASHPLKIPPENTEKIIKKASARMINKKDGSRILV